MKLLHLSDSHLGFSEYYKIDIRTGINQREQDFYDAWNRIIDAILARKPDIVVHAGDLFHSPRPSNRAIKIALQGIKKVIELDIPFVVVAGNHETPRIRATGSIFESLALFDHVYAAYQNRYERFTIKDVDIHCIPHCSLTSELDMAIQSVEFQKARYNILVCHGAWAGDRLYGMGEFNEQRLPDIEAKIRKEFDYIALGHYHRHLCIKPHVCYCGSTERTSLNEHNSSCGYLTVDLDSGKQEYITIDTRPMIRLPQLDCTGQSAVEIYDNLSHLVSPEIDGAIVHLSLVNIEQDTFVKLDIRQFDDIFSSVFYLEKHLFRSADPAVESAHHSRIEAIPLEFERYIASLNLEETNLKKLSQIGIDYLTRER